MKLNPLPKFELCTTFSISHFVYIIGIWNIHMRLVYVTFWAAWMVAHWLYRYHIHTLQVVFSVRAHAGLLAARPHSKRNYIYIVRCTNEFRLGDQQPHIIRNLCQFSVLAIITKRPLSKSIIQKKKKRNWRTFVYRTIARVHNYVTIHMNDSRHK